MGVGRELQSTVLLRDDHAEEPVLFQEGPGLFVQVTQFFRDLPVIDHVAKLIDRAIDEGLFLGA